MNVLMNIDREMAIKAGNEHFGEQVVDLPLETLSSEERAVLARIPTRKKPVDGKTIPVSDLSDYGDGTLGANGFAIARPFHGRNYMGDRIPGEPDPPRPEEATPEAAIELLRYWAQKLHAMEDYTRHAIETVVQQADTLDPSVAVIDNRLREQALVDAAAQKANVRLNNAAARHVIERAEVQSLLKKAEDLRAQQSAENRRALEQREARKKEQREKREKALEDWARQSGSERLRLAKETGEGDFALMAREEFFAAHAPPGFVRGTLHGVHRKRPTVEELRAFRWLKSQVEQSEGVLVEPSLDYVDSDDEDEEGDGSGHRVVLEVKVVAPDGQTAWFHASFDDLSQIPAAATHTA